MFFFFFFLFFFSSVALALVLFFILTFVSVHLFSTEFSAKRRRRKHVPFVLGPKTSFLLQSSKADANRDNSTEKKTRISSGHSVSKTIRNESKESFRFVKMRDETKREKKNATNFGFQLRKIDLRRNLDSSTLFSVERNRKFTVKL